jgi:hypothetical protein
LLDVVLAAWTRQDAGAVAAYTAKLPSGKPRNSYFLSSIDSWATDDPAAAAAFAAALAPGGLKKAAIESVAEAWSKSGDHTGAPEAWAATLADPALRQVAADYLHLGVAANDPLNAGPWLQSLPPGPEREDVVRDFIDDVVDGPHPEAAAPWADTLASARRRNRAIENVADAWADQDPAAAMAWLANTSLPDAQKQALLQQFQKTAAPAPP